MNICLLVEGGKITMVDAGLPGSSTGLLAYLDEIGLASQAVRRVIITHHHIDHVGGLPEGSSAAAPRSGLTATMPR